MTNAGKLEAGEREAILALDARFRRPLMSYFLRRTGNHAEAEDLTQQVFMRLISADNLDAVEHAEGYVFTIATNLLKDRGKRASLRFERSFPQIDLNLVAEISAEAIEDRSPERVLLARETLAGALKALEALGERTRDIFILHKVENMRHREIAEFYGLSVSSVEKYVIKATLHLARKYGRTEP